MLVHILLLILKILGFTVLGILGLVLVVLLLVLFAPIHYRIIGKSDDVMDLEIKFSYLLNFILGTFKVSKEKKEFNIYVFWGLLNLSAKNKKNKDYSKDFVVAKEDDETEDEREDTEDIEEEFEESSDEAFDEDEESFSSATVRKKNTKSKKNKSFSEKITELKENYFTETNKRAIAYLLKQVGYILKKYLPRKAKGNLFFGTTDPAMTGELLGALSLIPFMYQRGLNIYPDFESEEFYLQGKMEVKGFIQLNVLLIALIRLLVNRDTRSLLKLFIKK